MTTKVGVWVDHREAVVVKISGEGEEIVHVDSEFESQPRRESDHPSGRFEAMQAPSDDTRERRKHADLNHFYDDVISHFGHLQSLYIFGPGEAKTELKKRVGEKHPGLANCVVETTDKMTQPQVVAKVNAHFRAK